MTPASPVIGPRETMNPDRVTSAEIALAPPRTRTARHPPGPIALMVGDHENHESKRVKPFQPVSLMIGDHGRPRTWTA